MAVINILQYIKTKLSIIVWKLDQYITTKYNHTNNTSLLLPTKSIGFYYIIPTIQIVFHLLEDIFAVKNTS